MLELFRVEAENQTALLTTGLLELERAPGSPQHLETLMRAAHSLKGAARIVGLDAAVRVAHALEDNFVAAQRGEFAIRSPDVDVMLKAVDLLAEKLPGLSLTTLTGAEIDLSERLQRPVGIVLKSELSGRKKEEVLAGAQPL